MPIFEYECQGCSERFEELMRRTDPDPVCPSCGNGDVQRLISHSSFQLKGSGWYATDYANKSRSSGDEATSASAESSSKKAKSKPSGSEAAAA